MCCSMLELTLILWTKYVNIHNVMYVSCLQKNTLGSELDGHVHVHCTEGFCAFGKSVCLKASNNFCMLFSLCYQYSMSQKKVNRSNLTCKVTYTLVTIK